MTREVACIHQESARDRLGDGVTKRPASSALEILARLACGEPVDPGEARQLLDAAASADPNDFLRALGVDRPTRIRMRNRALQSAFNRLPASGQWDAAKKLFAALDRFHSRVMPLLRKGRPIAELGEHEIDLRRAHWSATPRLMRVENLWRMFR